MINKAQLKQLIKEELSRFLEEGEEDIPTVKMHDSGYTSSDEPMSQANAGYVHMHMNKLKEFVVNFERDGRVSKETVTLKVDPREPRYFPKKQRSLFEGTLQVLGSVPYFSVTVTEQTPDGFIFRINDAMNVSIPLLDAEKGFPQLKEAIQQNIQRIVMAG